MAAKDKNKGGNIVIKKEEIIEGGHHGGAWKVAYADFVTAMMAFFLLMWLLNATTEDQRRGLADYFSPQNVLARNTSGTGQPFGGHTPYDQGSLTSDRGAEAVMPGKAPPPPDDDVEGDNNGKVDTPLTSDQLNGSKPNQGGGTETATGNAATDTQQTGLRAPGGGVAPKQGRLAARAEFLAYNGAGAKPKPAGHAQTPQDGATSKEDAKLLEDAAAAKQAAEQREHAAFQAAAEQIREAVAADMQLGDIAKQLSVDITPEGLRVQLLDEDREPMFASGAAAFNDHAKQLLQKVAPVLAKLPGQLSITGHTDANPYKGTDRSNWELSAERANATRRLLVDAGLPETRFNQVAGRADRDLLLPADPLAAANRRIAIVVLRATKTP